VAKFQESRTFTGKSADGCYKAAEAALPKVGFGVWKRRPMAWLLLARRSQPEGSIEGNVACRPGAGALVTIALSSDTVTDDALKTLAEQVFSAIAAELG